TMSVLQKVNVAELSHKSSSEQNLLPLKSKISSRSHCFTHFFNGLLIGLCFALLASGFTIIYFTNVSTDIFSQFESFWRSTAHESMIHDVFVLKDVSEAVEVVVDSDAPLALPSDDSCTHYNCFNVYRCSADQEVMKVYIYPVKRYVDENGVLISSPFTEEYWQLLETILDSEYYTDDPEKACLFIPSIDMLSQHYVRPKETSQILSSLPFWKNSGENHLLFNLIPGSFPKYKRRLDVNCGKAMIAGGGFDTWTYRPTLDISVPVYSSFSTAAGNRNIEDLMKSKRKWLLTTVQSNLVDVKTKNILLKLEEEYSEDFLLLGTNCGASNNSKIRCDKDSKWEIEHSEILKNSTFCLIMKSAYLAQPLLSDALMYGCIPVIVIDEYVLPFETKIDWKRTSVRIQEHALPEIVNILKQMSPETILQMRDQSLFIFEKYFSSMKAIVLSTLKILNERFFPQFSTPKEDWNKPLLNSLYRPLSLINPKLSLRPQQGFTAVILTYDRIDSLFEVIHRVVQSPSCVKVLVIWNNQRKKPPPAEKWPKISIPLKILQTQENKLSNRFYPYNDIETEGILAIDDDIIMLTADELEFGFQVWKELPDRIVGFPSRVHRWDNHTQKWRYESEWTNDASMVLTGAAFYHKFYNYLYTFEMPATIRNWVDEQMNCEDIAMNFLVANTTGKAPIKVTPRKKFRCPECATVDTLSADVMRHLNARSQCINRFSSIYRTMPLKAVEFRADPVLYKDCLPEKLKKYNHIGSL
ncbi:exostosin-2-like protein, partial [Leptotrombidium deliense]